MSVDGEEKVIYPCKRPFQDGMRLPVRDQRFSRFAKTPWLALPVSALGSRALAPFKETGKARTAMIDPELIDKFTAPI